MSGKTVISNYLPYETVTEDNYDEWKEYYHTYLISMYNSLVKHISNKINADWEREQVFTKFCKMVYNSSSKHILDI